MSGHEKLAAIASSRSDYARYGLDPILVAAWEDGARTDNRAGTYEWWYFDTHLDDGSKLVVIFMNKDLVTPDRPLSPILRLDLDLPDGRSYQKVVSFSLEEWSAADDRADVRLGTNRFYGDLHEYHIQATAEEVAVDVTSPARFGHGDQPRGTCCSDRSGIWSLRGCRPCRRAP